MIIKTEFIITNILKDKNDSFDPRTAFTSIAAIYNTCALSVDEHIDGEGEYAALVNGVFKHERGLADFIISVETFFKECPIEWISLVIQ